MLMNAAPPSSASRIAAGLSFFDLSPPTNPPPWMNTIKGAATLVFFANQKSNTLQQKNTSIFDNNAERAGLRTEFNDVARNTGRVAEMALAFSASALRDGKDISPQQAIDLFEEKLNKVGNSVFAMTDGEASRMIQTVKGSDEKSVPFLQVLRSLDEVAGTGKKGAPKPAPQAVTL